MKLNCHLVVNSSGSVRVVKSRPNLSWAEISIGLHIDVPDSLFERPTLHAVIKVPESASEPNEIVIEAAGKVHEAIEQATGLPVRISFE